jgi:hypothetical protein
MKFLTFILFLIFSSNSFAQEVIVNGYITDKASGEALVGATVFEIDTKAGTSTNKYGFYSLKIRRNQTILLISYVGFKTEKLAFNARQDTLLNIQLTPDDLALDEVVIKSQKSETIAQTPTGFIDIPVSELKRMPMLLGEPDIIKALAYTPGVSVGNEGSSGLLVRGGTPDQNLILLDEAVVYNVSHLFGFVSVFNPDALRKVALYKAGFPARFGGRLSSVLDITMKEGNNQEVKGEAGIGILSSRFTIEGPFSKKTKGKTSFMLSGRASYFGLLLLPNRIAFNQGNTDQYFNYWMYDFNGKVNHRFKDGSQLFVSFYNGYDFWRAWEGSQEERSKFGLTWGNSTGTIRYNRILNPKLFFRSVLTYTRYKYSLGTKSFLRVDGKQELVNSLTTQSSVRDITFKTGFDYYPNASHQIKFGTELTPHTYRPTFVETTYLVNPDTLRKINEPVRALEWASFVEDEIQITHWLKTNIGLRSVLFNVENLTYFSLEPRLNFNILLPNNFGIKGGYSRMKQFVHLLTGSGVGLPNDIWVPATKNVMPQTADQVALGVNKVFPKADLEISIEGYYKKLSNLIDYKNGESIFSGYNQSWENQIEKNGIGEAYGLELFLRKTEGRFSGWLAYTLAWNNRKFENLNQNNWFSANYDRRHTIALTLNYTGKKVGISLNWLFHTGQPTNLPVAVQQNFEGGYGQIFIYGDRNAFRMPAFHRLDLSFNFNRITKRNKQGILTTGLYNAYNHNNPFYLTLKQVPLFKQFDPANPEGVNYKLVQQSVFPILPFISYSVKF